MSNQVLQNALEALQWALDTLDDTDAYLRKVDTENYEKYLNLACDKVAKAKARRALQLLSEHAKSEEDVENEAPIASKASSVETQKALTPDLAARIVAVRDALVREDYTDAYYQLYGIADASFEKPAPWCQLEELAKQRVLSEHDGIQSAAPVTPKSEEELGNEAPLASKAENVAIQKALKETLDMALDEVWFTFRPKGYGALHCAMCGCNMSRVADHADGCYFNRLSAIASEFCPAKTESQGAALDPQKPASVSSPAGSSTEEEE